MQDLALRYVGKYATTRAKLAAYLARKLRERGWDGQREPDVRPVLRETVVEPIVVSERVVIPVAALSFRAVRASGPGG